MLYASGPPVRSCQGLVSWLFWGADRG